MKEWEYLEDGEPLGDWESLEVWESLEDLESLEDVESRSVEIWLILDMMRFVKRLALN